MTGFHRRSIKGAALALIVSVGGMVEAAMADSPFVIQLRLKDGVSSSAPMQDFANGEEVDGTSFLLRSQGAAAYSINTTDLDPGVAYTNWWVVFNRPDQCVDRCACSEADITPDSPAEPGIFFAAGRVADDFGQASFSGQIDYGELPTGVEQIPVPVIAQPASVVSEIHIVVRRHGPAAIDPAALEEQLTRFNGGCENGTCTDTQFTIHRSPFCKVRFRRF